MREKSGSKTEPLKLRNQDLRGTNDVESEVPARAEFYGEIGEVNSESTRDFPKDALEETGQNVPANYYDDENWGEGK